MLERHQPFRPTPSRKFTSSILITAYNTPPTIHTQENDLFSHSAVPEIISPTLKRIDGAEAKTVGSIRTRDVRPLREQETPSPRRGAAVHIKAPRRLRFQRDRREPGASIEIGIYRLNGPTEGSVILTQRSARTMEQRHRNNSSTVCPRFNLSELTPRKREPCSPA